MDRELPFPSIAIQGEAGSFSHEAALAMVPGASVVSRPISAEVFRTLCEGEVDAAVIPIENSLAGSVLEHYDLLLAQPVRIEGEFLLRIQHNLIGAPGATLAGLREVYSHPIALDQCRGFFRAHPGVRAASFYDTAGAVKHVVASAAKELAAIASRQAAAQYGGVVLADGIEDNPENYTRFLLVRRQAEQRPLPHTDTAAASSAPANKVSLCFAVENRPGSLVDALQVFARQHTNLTRIESRPVPGSPWQYIFYADYEMHQPDKADAALAELGRHCSMVKELGRYPAAIRR